MSKPTKLKNVKKKKMSQESKATLSNAFRGIISNEACVNGGKESPWWVACIFLVLSILLPLIPIMVSASNIYGAAPLSGPNYGADEGLADTFKTAHANGYEFKVENSQLHFYKNGSELTTTPETAIASHLINTSDPDLTTYSFILYITNKTGGEFNDFVAQLGKDQYESHSLIARDPAKEEEYIEKGTTFYVPSFLVLGKDTFGMALYQYDSTLAATSTYSGLDYTHFTNHEDLITDVIFADGSATISECLDNFRSILNKAFINAKEVSFRNSTLIYLGVYTALILFLGLMVFILTRGKNNVFNYLSFFKCQRITWWASFTPALLGMILAFLMSGNVIGQMGFVVLLSLRIMWLSMKQLRPIQ